MSRITGIVNKSLRNFRQTSLLLPSLQALKLNQDWKVSTERLGQVILGWCGWHSPNLFNENGIVIVLDGYFYNRKALGSATDDVSLMGELYLNLGLEKALQLINGDFALVLYDLKIDTLWLARDRFGLKPLYYVMKPEYFAFASQPRGLFPFPNISKDTNHKFVATFAASHYRYFDNNIESSPYREIMQLPAAHCLRFSQGKITKSKYWELSDSRNFEDSHEEELAEQYRELLLDAVSLRIASSRNPTFTLSGGMDSSSILAAAVYTSERKFQAFSTTYVDKTYDESDEIRPMLDSHLTQWHPVLVDVPDVFYLIQKMIEIHDEPIATATWLSHFLLCNEVVSKKFDSLFGGLGGDELNAGEYEHFFFHFADLRFSGNENQLEKEVDKWIRYHDHPIFRKSFALVEKSLNELVNLNKSGECYVDRVRLEKYSSVLNPDFFSLQGFQPEMDHYSKSYLKNRTYQDIFRETIPCCLRAEDRHTAAHNLDNFLPFFDYRLVEFMFRVPGFYKIRNGVTKVLLRRAMKGLLPEETRKRVKKTGWNAPAHIWFSGEGKEKLLDLVGSRSFKERGIYDTREVIRLIEDHERIVSSQSIEENHMMFLWQLVNLELWFRSNDSNNV